MNKRSQLTYIAFFFVLIFMSCGKDDPINPRNLTVTPSTANLSGVRGTNVDVTAIINADDGIQSVKASTSQGEEEIFTISADATTFTATHPFTIPANAVMNTTYTVTFEVVDKDGDRESSDVIVTAGPLLTATPNTYEFTRNGATTVSYSGQNERLDMVEEIKAYLKTADSGILITEQALLDAYANTNNNGNNFFSFTSTKDLKSKTFQPDLDNEFMEDLFKRAAAASASSAMAADGTAGLIVRENSGNTVLIDAKGREFTQFIEKGLMGTVMYNQIYNTYFTDARTGNDVENTELRENENYTDMEHHWDEAFGYWNPPLDFTSNWPEELADADRFWSHYSNTVDPHLGTNDQIMQAYLKGRAAIVNNDLEEKDVQRAMLYESLDLVTAAVAIHYINDTQEALNDGKRGEAFHVLSEAWAFTNALRYNPNRKLSLDKIEEIMEKDFGTDGNFWNVTSTGLNKAKATIVGAYAELVPVQDQL